MKVNSVIRSMEEYPGLDILYHHLPQKTLCSNSKAIEGEKRKYSAIYSRYIRINTDDCIHAIVFDLDYPGAAFAYEKHGLALFSFAVVNTVNAHCHGIYMIKPVYLKKMPTKLKWLMKRVPELLKDALSADRAITRHKQLVKNPFHKGWELAGSGKAYTLTDLLESIPCNLWRERKKRNSNKRAINKDSRNVMLFNLGRLYAYRIVKECATIDNLHTWILDYLHACNRNELLEHFTLALPQSEVRTITRSITRWVWARRDNFRKKGLKRGSMGFKRIKGLPYKEYIKEVKRRQSLSGIRTSRIRRTRTLHMLMGSYMRLLKRYGEATQTMLRDKTKLSLRTVKHYWKEMLEGAERSIYQGNIHRVNRGLYQEEAGRFLCMNQGCVLYCHSRSPPGMEVKVSCWNSSKGVEPWSMRRYASGARGK